MELRVVISAVVERNGAILMAKKPLDKPPYPGTWVLPGGKLLPEETIEEGATRKVRSESGIEIQILQRLSFDEEFVEMNNGETVHFVFLVLLAEHTAGEAHGEVGGFENPEWISKNKLQELSDSKQLAPASIRLFRTIGWTE